MKIIQTGYFLRIEINKSKTALSSYTLDKGKKIASLEIPDHIGKNLELIDCWANKLNQFSLNLIGKNLLDT